MRRPGRRTAWPRHREGMAGIPARGMRPWGFGDAAVVVMPLKKKETPLNPPEEGPASSPSRQCRSPRSLPPTRERGERRSGEGDLTAGDKFNSVAMLEVSIFLRRVSSVS